MIKIGDKYFELKIERKNISNMYLRVNRGTLLITCPRNLSNEKIDEFIKQKSGWITKVLQKEENNLQKSKLIIGDYIYYLGKQYKFIIKEGRPSLKFDKDTLIVFCSKGTVEDAINVFYKESKKVLLELIYQCETKYIDILKDYGYHNKPTYRVRILKSMWGVNYPKKNQITINEKLIHFDVHCLEAILWHELLHFVLPNHSKRYYEVLNMHMPDYKETVDSIF